MGGHWIWLLEGHNCAEAKAPFGSHGLSSKLWFLCCFQEPGMGEVERFCPKMCTCIKTGLEMKLM